MTIGDREVRLDYAFPWREKGSPPLPRRGVKDRHEPGPTIFVGNVPHEATKEDICEALGPLGNVTIVRIGALFRRSGQRNYALNIGSYST